MLVGGWQLAQLVLLTFCDEANRKITRIELPDGQPGALYSATRGLAVGVTTAVASEIREVMRKVAFSAACSPVVKSLAITRNKKVPSRTEAAMVKVLSGLKSRTTL